MSNNRFPYGGDDSHLCLFPCKLAPFHWVLAFYFKEYFKLETHFTMLAEVAFLWDSSIGLWRLVFLTIGLWYLKMFTFKREFAKWNRHFSELSRLKNYLEGLEISKWSCLYVCWPVFMFVGQETHQWKKGRWSRGK